MKPIRVTIPSAAEYEVFPTPDGQCGHVVRLDHHEYGTRRREVWSRLKTPGRTIATVIKLAGFEAEAPYVQRAT